MSFFQNAQDFVATNNTIQINVDRSVRNYYQNATASLEGTNNLTASLPKVSYRPNSSTLFQGRRAELDKLKDHFEPAVSQTRRSLLLYGMGGIGKTQICLKFSYIFWIDASTVETTILSLRGLPEARAANSDDSAESVVLFISRLDKEWLLIFDNADEHIHKFMPPGNSGNIILSSRNPSIGRSTSFNRVEVTQMDEEDAISLLLKASCLNESPVSDELKSTAKAIVTELCCLPLAVDQAGASIESGLCQIDDYLRHYSDCRMQLLDDPSFTKASIYEQTVYGTWELSYQEIESRTTKRTPGPSGSSALVNAVAAQTAILILETFACLHHDNIGKDIFRRAAADIAREKSDTSILQGDLLRWNKKGVWDELHFQSGIRVLLSFSLIKQDRSGTVYSAHPLVHSWSQDRMPPTKQQLSCKRANFLLSSSFPSSSSTGKDYQFLGQLVPHITANFHLATEAGLEGCAAMLIA
ncbi:P-loop containing nucleoside triphosphate hydrolase protein [Gymnopilus junonius]|uniref:P-loop containing nucleoside triphosphate hydrolase protein n=1 Tax=Gymnopilus junonius TaxID=109634 RepID=A0A9P5NZJ5_GYMJU|nr:P-loop containing nucleoside triphosphate hydrolase protein [Gymnopilus junonius]